MSSLFLIGSCSKITTNIVLALARKNLYTKITIADLLPHHTTFNRFYHLKKLLESTDTTTQVGLTRLLDLTDISDGIHAANNVLFVTHDYYKNVTSKTKLMQLTAEAAKRVDSLTFVTPLQYDHFGYENPAAKYNEAQANVKKIAPHATILRSELVEHGQFYNYVPSNQNILFKWRLRANTNHKFAPKIVKSVDLTTAVTKILETKIQGKQYYIQGHKEVPLQQFKPQKQQVVDCINRNDHFINLYSKYSYEFGQAEPITALGIQITA